MGVPLACRLARISAARSASALEIGRTSNCKEWTFCKLAATRLLLYAPKPQLVMYDRRHTKVGRLVGTEAVGEHLIAFEQSNHGVRV